MMAPDHSEFTSAYPALWIAVSILLVNMLRKHGDITKVSGAFSESTDSLKDVISLPFVDDTDLFYLAEDPDKDPIEVA